MTTRAFFNCERTKLGEMKNYQLPNRFKKIGIAIALISFASLFINKFSVNLPEYRLFARYGLLVGMLLISISKEKIEDELIAQLRMQSYTIAFVLGVVYTLALPFIDYFVDVLFKTNEAIIKDIGDFQILWILLCVQVFYFESLKRFHK